MTQLDLAKSAKRHALVRPSLLALTACFAASAFAATPAHADGVDPAQVQALQQQIQALQAEIDGLVANQVKQSKKISSIAPAKGSVVVSSPGKGKIKIGAVTVTLGGYVEADGIYRSKAMQADLNSKLSGVPFNATVLGTGGSGRQSEFRETARATRFSVGLAAKANSYTNLSAYLEGDFLGYAGTGASTNSTNGFSPRLRQGWAGYERTDYGLHVFAGQTYSLATQESLGLSPGKEAGFPLIDSATGAGFVNVRQAGLRVFKDFDQKYFLGISFENPTMMVDGTPNTVGGNANDLPNSVSGNSSISGATLSDDVAPDVIVKGAADTSFGHYELFGIGRFLRSREGTVSAAGTPLAGHSTIKTVGGVGVSAFDSVVPKKLDIQGNFIIGDGIARYSAAQLGDVTFDGAGGLVPLQSVVGQIGATGHITPTLDIYTVGGVELIHGGGTGNHDVYGNGVASTGTCGVPGASCSPEIKQVDELSAGSWWSFYKGAAGTMSTGIQYSYLRDEAFAGSGAKGYGTSPHAADNLVFLSFRYAPFK